MNLKHLFLLSVAAVPSGALAADPQVDVRTSLGTIRLELYPAKAPRTVENFLQYVKDGHYNGTIFHRVIDGFMVQGGGFDKAYHQKSTRAPVVNEAQSGVKGGLKNEVGTLAMARTADPNSATAQFFINVADNAFLDYKAPSAQHYGYCVFGKVVGGKDVVDRITGVATGRSGMHENVPTEDVVILRAEEVA
jgi:cyclophilin family peptidyl-prolyl cis-trans isomerase